MQKDNYTQPQPDLSAYLERAIPYTEEGNHQSKIERTRKLLKAVSMLYGLQKIFEEKISPEWQELASKSNTVYYYHDLNEIQKQSIYATTPNDITPRLSLFIWQDKPVIKIENLQPLKNIILFNDSPNPLKPLFLDIMRP